MGTIDGNRRAVARLYEGFDRRNIAGAADVLHEDLVVHNAKMAPGRAGFVGFLEQVLARAPEMKLHVKRVVADEDHVVVHSHIEPAPGARGRMAVDIFRLADGMVVEHWDIGADVAEQSVSGNPPF